MVNNFAVNFSTLPQIICAAITATYATSRPKPSLTDLPLPDADAFIKSIGFMENERFQWIRRVVL